MKKLGAVILALSLPAGLLLASAVVRPGVTRQQFAVVVGAPVVPTQPNTFMQDSFTGNDGTVLSTHTGESAAWVRHSSYTTQTAILDTSRAVSNTAAATFMYYVSTNTLSLTADYYVEALIFNKTTTTQGAGPAIRVSTTANTMYFTRYRQSTGTWELWKLVAGASTQLSSYTVSQLANKTWDVTLGAVGSSITVTIDGTEQMNVVDTSITAAGRAGIRGIDPASSGHQVTLIQAYDPQ